MSRLEVDTQRVCNRLQLQRGVHTTPRRAPSHLDFLLTVFWGVPQSRCLLGVGFPPWPLNSVPTALCGNAALLPLTEGCNKVWQHASVVLTVTPLHKKRRSREPPWTSLLHRRTKITGLQITYRTGGTGAIARSQYELEDFTSQSTGLDKEFP